MVVNTANEVEEDKRVVRMAGLRKQGVPMNWEVPEKKISSMKVVGMQESKLGFMVKSVYDLLPTPLNRSRWLMVPRRDASSVEEFGQWPIHYVAAQRP